jgi:hypothetical protein
MDHILGENHIVIFGALERIQPGQKPFADLKTAVLGFNKFAPLDLERAMWLHVPAAVRNGGLFLLWWLSSVVDGLEEPEFTQ